MRTVGNIQALPHLLGQRVDLTWQNPSPADFEGVGELFIGIHIVRNERTFPLSPDDGTSLYDETQPVIDQFSDVGLHPLTTYYYTIFTIAQDQNGKIQFYADNGSRNATFATKNYNLSELLYRLLPATHQRNDTLNADELRRQNPALSDKLDGLPPQLYSKGQLWRFFYAIAAPLDLMRSFAEGLPLLHNLDLTRPEFLLPLARSIGWDLDRTLPVFAQRNEIKFAPHLYRNVGTIPNLRATVTRYTGWYAQIAEFAQNLVLSNKPPQLNIFAAVENTNTWQGTDDAAAVLGFSIGSDNTNTTDGTPARLISTKAGPFTLRPEMELAVTADNRIPVAVRFQPGDFVDIGHATANEVVAVLNRTLSEVTAIALADGHITLNSHTLGSAGHPSSLQVEHYAASLVTLEGAPCGRLSTLIDTAARVRLFYETADPSLLTTTIEASQVASGQPFVSALMPGETPLMASTPLSIPVQLPSVPQGHIRYKTFRQGVWGESHPLVITGEADSARGDPAAVVLSDGRVGLAWVDQPHSNNARLRFMLGKTHTPQPARLTGQRRAPFIIQAGTRILLRGNWPETEEVFEFTEQDITSFANPRRATALEVRDALNSRLIRVVAAVQPNQTLALTTAESGGNARLEIDLQFSNAAQALGFNVQNAIATGDWGDTIDWPLPPQDIVPTATTGQYADLSALVDGSGDILLFWSEHHDSNWNIVLSRWKHTTQVWSLPETLADGSGGNREPCAIVDNTGHIWLFWSRRQGVGTPEDVWTLQRRVFDGVSWDTETSVISTGSEQLIIGRQPGVVRIGNNDLRLFFHSDRIGGLETNGLNLWSVTITPNTGAISIPRAVTGGPTADYAPAPLLVPDDTLWLLYRSDRSIPLSRIATRVPPEGEERITATRAVAQAFSSAPVKSVRISDTGTLRRFAGATSVIRSNVARNKRRRQWDDLLSYTPQKSGDGELKDDDLYTRGTVGLYLNQQIQDSPLSPLLATRLRAVLERFLPINVRAVVILSPRIDIEYIYSSDADMQESYQDIFPYAEYYSGLDESTGVALPEWILLHSNRKTETSVNPVDPSTLRSRSYFPPPQ